MKNRSGELEFTILFFLNDFIENVVVLIMKKNNFKLFMS